MKEHITEEQQAENKRLYDALEGQVCPTSDGVRQTLTTSLSNLVPGIKPAPGMMLEFSNIPKSDKGGRPILTTGRELCISQLSLDPELITPEQVAELDPLTRKRYEHLQQFPLLEYECTLELQYGRFDQVAPDDALKTPAFRASDRHTKKALEGGFMDVIVVKPDTHQMVTRRDDKGEAHEVRVPIKRTQSYRMNLYDIRRAMRRQVGESFKIWSRPGMPSRFIRQVGRQVQSSHGNMTVVTHIVIICMPARGVPAARTDKPVPLGAAGRDGRGLAIVIPIENCKVAEWTYQTILLPGFDYNKEQPEVEGCSLMVSWLSMCPTPENSVAFLDKLLEGTAEAITSDKDNEGLEKVDLDVLLADTDDTTSSADAAAVNGDATTGASETDSQPEAATAEGQSDATEDSSEEDDGPKAVAAADDSSPDSSPEGSASAASEQPEGATSEPPAETAAEAPAADAAPATETHVEFTPATADALD